MDTNEMDVMDAAPGSLGELIPAPRRQDAGLPAAMAAAGGPGVDVRIEHANRLHGQCERLARRVIELTGRTVHTAVMLGYELLQIKASLPHGEFQKLFKGKNDTCVAFDFSPRSSQRYQKLYKAAEARFNKLQGKGMPRLAEVMEMPGDEVQRALARVTDATTLRQALIELEVIAPPEDPAAILMGNRNEAGRPAEEEEGAGAARESWEEARKLALHAAGKLATETASYIETGRLGFLERAEKELLLATLRRAAMAVEDSLRQPGHREEVTGNSPVCPPAPLPFHS